jgi:hypothetical protein
MFCCGVGRSISSAGCCGSWCSIVAADGFANQFGWITAEVGRQPWIVYASYENGDYANPIGGLRTIERCGSKSVDANEVLISIIWSA